MDSQAWLDSAKRRCSVPVLAKRRRRVKRSANGRVAFCSTKPFGAPDWLGAAALTSSVALSSTLFPLIFVLVPAKQGFPSTSHATLAAIVCSHNVNASFK
jgi:hypothetical protein